jgi:hypothetical protein
MKETLLSVVFLASSFAAFCQPSLHWTETLTGPGNPVQTDMTIDADGNCYVLGFIMDTTVSEYKCVLAKYDVNGDTLWTALFDGIANNLGSKIALDQNNDVVVTGYQQLTWQPLVFKYSGNGDFLWAKEIAAPGISTFSELKIGQDNMIYTAGLWDSSKILVVKLNPDGDTLWTAVTPALGTDQWYTTLSGFDVDQNGNVYASAIMNEPDSILGYPSTENDFVLAKFDTNGNLEWFEFDYDAGTEVYGDLLHNAIICEGSEVYVLQPYPGYIPGCTTTPSLDIVLMNYSPDGTQNWRQHYAHSGSQYNFPYTMRIYDQHVYIGGMTYTSPTHDTQYLTLQCDMNGDNNWMKTYNKVPGTPDQVYDLAVDNGLIYTLGINVATDYSIVMVAYDESGNQVWALPRSAPSDDYLGMVIKADPIGIYVSGLIVNSTEETALLTYKYTGYLDLNEAPVDSNAPLFYPNPTSGFIYTSAEFSEGTYRITNASGQLIASGSFAEGMIPVHKLAKGTYVLQVEAAGKMETGLVVIQP